MRCAAEFIMMKKEAIAKHETELEAIRSIRRENAINFIETFVSDELTKKALNRQSLEICLEAAVKEDEIGKYFCSMSWSCTYADGLKSGWVRPDAIQYDYNTFIEYLKKHCIICADSGAIHKYAGNTRKDIHYCNKFRIFIPAESNRDYGI